MNLIIVLVSCILTVIAAVQDEIPLRDAKLEQLKKISNPRTFTSTEMATIHGQLDTLKLGMDLFLAHDAQIAPNEQQAAFNEVWPLLSCLFKGDFERGANLVDKTQL